MSDNGIEKPEEFRAVFERGVPVDVVTISSSGVVPTQPACLMAAYAGEE